MSTIRLTVIDSSSPIIPVGKTLLYDDDASPLSRQSTGNIYPASPEDQHGTTRYLLKIPNSVDALPDLEREYGIIRHLTRISNTMPHAALVQQANSDWYGLAQVEDGMSLASILRGYIEEGHWANAEQTALRAAHQYLQLLLNTYEAEQAYTAPDRNANDLLWSLAEERLIIMRWEKLIPTSPGTLITDLRAFAQAWYALYFGRHPRQGITPFADDAWQIPNHDLPEGCVSVGLRLILARALQPPPGAEHVSLHGLNTATEQWLELFSQSTRQIDEDTSARLGPFLKALPAPGLNQAEIEAVWQDLRWRIHSRVGHIEPVLTTLRTNSLMNVHLEPGATVTAPDHSLADLQEALRQGDIAQAQVIAYSRRLQSDHPSEMTASDPDWASYFDYLDWAGHEAPADVTLQLPHIMAMAQRLLSQPAIRDDERLSRQLAQRVQTHAQYAQTLLEQAISGRTWADLQRAQVAMRIFQYQAGYRHLIESLRPVYPAMPEWDEIDPLLDQVTALRATYLQLAQSALAFTAHKNLSEEPSPAQARQQAAETLRLLRIAVETGIDMGDIVDANENQRQQWQAMITDALQALSQIDTIRAAVERVETTTQDEVLRLSRQMNDLIAEVGDLPSRVLDDLAGMRARLDQMERQLDERGAAMGMASEKMNRTSRLLDDLREQFERVQADVRETSTYEGNQFSDYIAWVSEQEMPTSIPDVLSQIDDLVYALRRLPPNAYTLARQTAWTQMFDKMVAAYESLADAEDAHLARNRFRARARRALAEARHHMREKFEVCRQEAQSKADVYRSINTPRDTSIMSTREIPRITPDSDL